LQWRDERKHRQSAEQFHERSGLPCWREERNKIFATFRNVRLIAADDERFLKMMEA
jgi:hypothetical protein